MLENIWFVLWGVLWAVYFILDGFDLGAGALLPFLARDESDRLRIHNAIGPYWDGNEVWLIAAGGITFAAFPGAYGTMFSALYTPLMLLLFMLILRGAAVGLRPEVETIKSKHSWDIVFTVSSAATALLLGVAFANIFMGVPIDKQGVLQGNLISLLNLFGLTGGVLFLIALMHHGAIWIVIKTEGGLSERAASFAHRMTAPVIGFAVLFLVEAAFITELWDNYLAFPPLFVIPGAAVISLLALLVLVRKGAWPKAFVASAVFIGSAVAYGLAGMYPALLPSSIEPAYDVTINNAASGPHTLTIMLGVALVFVPIVIGYQFFVYRVFKGKVSDDEYGH